MNEIGTGRPAAAEATQQCSRNSSKPAAQLVPKLVLTRLVEPAKRQEMASVDFSSSLTQCARQLCLALATAAASSRMRVDLYLSSVGQPLNLFVEASVF